MAPVKIAVMGAGLIGKRHVDGRTHLDADRLRHLLGPSCVYIQQSLDQTQTLCRTRLRPAFERTFCRSDGAISIAGAANAD